MPSFMRPAEIFPNEKKPPAIPAAARTTDTHTRSAAAAASALGPIPSSAVTENFDLSATRPMQVEYLRGYLPDSKDWLRKRDEAREKEAARKSKSRHKSSSGSGERERERRKHKRSRKPKEAPAE